MAERIIREARYRNGLERAMYQAVYSGIVEMVCPHCCMEIQAEPDADYDVKCEGCDNVIRVRGVI